MSNNLDSLNPSEEDSTNKAEPEDFCIEPYPEPYPEAYFGHGAHMVEEAPEPTYHISEEEARKIVDRLDLPEAVSFIPRGKIQRLAKAYGAEIASDSEVLQQLSKPVKTIEDGDARYTTHYQARYKCYACDSGGIAWIGKNGSLSECPDCKCTDRSKINVMRLPPEGRCNKDSLWGDGLSGLGLKRPLRGLPHTVTGRVRPGPNLRGMRHEHIDPPPLSGPEVSALYAPLSRWRCNACGKSIVYHTERIVEELPFNCPDCGRPRNVT